jgi:hypothetical protein
VSVVRLSPEAVDELVEAAAWYRGQRPGLESEFLAEVDRVLLLIGGSPASFPRLLDAPEDLMLRRALLPRFPYTVIFMDLVTEDGILAVAHAKRPARLLARSRRVRRLSASRVGTRSEVPRFRARRAALGHTRDDKHPTPRAGAPFGRDRGRRSIRRGGYPPGTEQDGSVREIPREHSRTSH